MKRVVILLLACFVAAGIVAGCGSPLAQGPHLPDVSTTFEQGPGRHEVTIGVESKGDGVGLADLVLTMPNGHRKVRGDAMLEDGLAASWGLRELKPGDYSYTIYAVATKTPSKDLQFPDDARTEDHILGEGHFTIP